MMLNLRPKGILFHWALIAAAAIASAGAQTVPHIERQTRGEPAGEIRLCAVLTNGDIRCNVRVGPGLTLTVGAGGVITIDAAPAAPPPASPVQVWNETPVLDPANNMRYTLANTPAAGSLRLHLNGIRTKEGEDFTLAGAVITLAARFAGGTSDKLLADYQR